MRFWKTLSFILVAGMLMFALSCQMGTDGFPLEETGPSRSMVATCVPAPDKVGIVSAVLTLWVTDFTSPVPVTVRVHNVTAPWDEATVSWSSFAGAYDPAAAASVQIIGVGAVSIDVKPLVQAWANGACENYGMLLEQGVTSYCGYSSSEAAIVECRPSLTVTSADHSVTIQRSGSGGGVHDAFITARYPGSSEGNSPWLYSGLIEGYEKQSLLAFDVTFKEQEGSTRTIGYWKNHAGRGRGNQVDMVNALLPIWLGTPSGAKSLAVTTNAEAYAVFTAVAGNGGNGIIKLRAQLLGAKLNIAARADPSDVQSAISAADAILAKYNPISWTSLSRAVRAQVNQLASTLDEYNNGLIGPGHAAD